MDNIPHEILQQGGFIGPRFTGVFFFEQVFWRVSIPLIWGTRRVDPLDALRIMPPDTKHRLVARPDSTRKYLMLWADCYDYDTGFQNSQMCAASGSFLNEMIESTERELTSAIGDLCQQRPNSKAMHSARDTMEKIIKAYLCHQTNLTSDRAKKHFSHRLDKLVQEVTRHAPQSGLAEVERDLDAFAPYEDRYTSNQYTREQLWRAYRIAQFAAAEVLRTISGVNQRAVIRKLPIFSEQMRDAG